MQALMLAAGMGKRLGKYTHNATKCMLPVNGKTLIEYAIESLLAADIHKLVMVVGYKKEVLKDFLKGKYPQMKIEYIDNDVYDITNNIYSLYLARNVLAQDDTILLESDLIYDKSIIQEIAQSMDENLAVVSPFESWMDGSVTVLNEHKQIKGILGKADFLWEDRRNYYKTVNIYKFSKEFTSKYYLPFLEAYQIAYGKNEYYETVLKVVAFLDNTQLKAHIVDGSRWYEIDDAADKAIAETRFSTGKEHLKKIAQTYGGYWRYPSMLDYCYLVNPYFPPKGMIDEMKANFEPLLQDYPSGDRQQSLLAAKIFDLEPEHVAVGNGAAELIASYAQIRKEKVVVPYPTFNEYPERFGEDNVIWYKVQEDFSYTTEAVFDFAVKNDAQSILLINPENPSGHFFSFDEVCSLAKKMMEVGKTLILDESFADFAQKDLRFSFISEKLIEKYPNVVVIKSISKSYGVPGLRLGLLVSKDEELIYKIQRNTSIWNINSFAEYFLQIFDKHKKTYSQACDKIASERERFSAELSKIEDLKVYPSQANYILVELLNGKSSEELVEKMLDKHNIFMKDLSTKKGFDGKQFIRITVRNQSDDDKFLTALKEEM